MAIISLKKITKQLLFVSRMPKLCAILQLVSAPLNSTPLFEPRITDFTDFNYMSKVKLLFCFLIPCKY